MKCNVIEEVKKLTGGYGCDVYIEVSGSPASVNQGLVKMLLSFATTDCIASYFCKITIIRHSVVCCSYSDTISVLITVQCTQRHRYTQITHRLHTDTHRCIHILINSHTYIVYTDADTQTQRHTQMHIWINCNASLYFHYVG